MLEAENDTKNDKNLTLMSHYSDLCFMLITICHVWPSTTVQLLQAAYTGS